MNRRSFLSFLGISPFVGWGVVKASPDLVATRGEWHTARGRMIKRPGSPLMLRDKTGLIPAGRWEYNIKADGMILASYRDHDGTILATDLIVGER